MNILRAITALLVLLAVSSGAGEAPAKALSVKLITSFEDKNPFDNGTVVNEHATDGQKALRIDRQYAAMEGHQDWQGYDLLKFDFFTESKSPQHVYIEIRDNQTTGYYTRVNYDTVVPPGQSTLVLALRQLFAGEKSKPGRNLILNGITRLVVSIDEKPPAPLYVDNIRVERDDSMQEVQFEGLHAYDFQPDSGPLMDGFTAVTPASQYTKARGFGFQNAQIWRPDMSNVLQPDPLYQDFLCIESGNFIIDLPNGRYHVFINLDNPGGYWGEVQNYKQRRLLAQDKEVAVDTQDVDSFKRKYFRFWNTDDLPTEATFDKYQKVYFPGKQFDVDVQDGKLKLGFEGSSWACSASCVIVYPSDKAAQGEKFMKAVEAKRRFYFDNYFKRVLHPATGDPLQPTGEEQKQGMVAFPRDIMQDIYYNDTPFKAEMGKPLTGDAFAGEFAALSLGVRPLQDLGKVTLAVSDLEKQGDKIPAGAVNIGYVSYRLSRITMEGSVYTLCPRYILPMNSVFMPSEITRQFWLTVKVPVDARPGLYRGVVTLKSEKAGQVNVPVELNVRNGTLDELDIPAGPIGCGIGLPFDDPGARQWEDAVLLKSLKRMREHGFTGFSGLISIPYHGFKDGQPVLDFVHADKWMKIAKDLGFIGIQGYGAGVGINAYVEDLAQMKAAGFNDYSEFLKAVYTVVQKHADANGWLPIYYNLGDENPGDDTVKNAEAYRKAFPKGPPYFTALFSFSGKNTEDKAFKWSKALHIAGWNLHDEDGVKLIHDNGGEWGFYNGGSRWTFGDYMYKAVKQFGLKYRVSWHWNCNAGDPYYALDCREDDYAWCNATPDGELIPDINLFERKREGLGDYRRLLTLARLCKEKAGTSAASAGEKLIADRMASFKLGQREHDELFGFNDWKQFRNKVSDAIEALRK